VFAETRELRVGGETVRAGVLRDNGGPTQTIAIGPDSLAVDGGIETAGVPTTDQRGVTRFDALPGDGVVDIGAFELARGNPVHTIGNASEHFNRSAPNAWAEAWIGAEVTITHTADRAAGAPSYSAVDFGTRDPGRLEGSDMLDGDLGVSGRAGLQTAAPQEIGGTEALRFAFASGEVRKLAFDFTRFEAGDTARFELFDAAGDLVRTEVGTGASPTLGDLANVAAVAVSAEAGSFLIDSLTITEAQLVG
jgi:hypothetical protein